jgi:hypothetical protein
MLVVPCNISTTENPNITCSVKEIPCAILNCPNKAKE